MAIIEANGQRFIARAIVFDKDGTLVDIHQLWVKRTWQWIMDMTAQAGGDAAMREAFCRALGVDVPAGRLTAEGPAAVATSEVVGTLAAGVLYRYGRPWHEAAEIARSTAMQTIMTPVQDGEMKPLGDVLNTIERFVQAGLTLAVATGDDRWMTEANLTQLGVRRHMSALLCGDDPAPRKPDAGVLAWISGQIAIPTGEMVMVGDTVTDILAGRNAGAAGCIGIREGAGDPALLSHLADAVVDRIDQIRVID
jgi:phosphoglycolate phosphatase